MRRREALQKAGITHVISALCLPLDPDLYANYKHLVVEVYDMEDEDLLQHFATTNAFIRGALDAGGAVVVHWWVPFLSILCFFPFRVPPCNTQPCITS